MMGRTPELTAIEERYPDEWVAVHVTKRDSDGFALDGNVVAHDPNPDIVHEQARAYRKGRANLHFYIFFSGDIVPPGWGILPTLVVTGQGDDFD